MKSLKRAWPGALLLAVAALSAPVVAKSDAANSAEITVKIGGVDFQKLLLNSDELKRSMNLLKEQFESERKHLLQMRHDLKVHPEDAQLQQQFSTQAADFQKRAAASRDAAVNEVSASIVASIKQYGANGGFDLIVGGTPLFVPPLTPRAVDVPDITARIADFMRHPSAAAPMQDRPADAASIKIGRLAGMSIEKRSGEQVRAIRDAAAAKQIQMVFEYVYFSQPSIEVIDIGPEVRSGLDPESMTGGVPSGR